MVERFAALLRLYGAPDSPDPARLNRDYMECLGQEAFLLPGAADFCRALNGMGLTLAIATNGLPGPQRGRYVRTRAGQAGAQPVHFHGAGGAEAPGGVF